MFRKLKAGLSGKSSKAKYRLDVSVSHVEGLPPGVGACRLQWARGAKVAVTKLQPAAAGVVTWDEEQSQIATLLKTPVGFESKQYEFKLQAPAPSSSSSAATKPPVTIGKAVLDMGRFAAAGGAALQPVVLPVGLPGGGRCTLHLAVRATEVQGHLALGGGAADDDAMSVMTGASGLTSSGPSAVEQDLSGFRLEGSSSAPREIPVSISSAAATLGGEVVSEPSGGSSHTHTQPEAAAAVPPSSNSNADHASAALAVEASASERVQLASSEVEAAVGAEAEVAQGEAGRDAQLAQLHAQLAMAQEQLTATHLDSGNGPETATAPEPVPVPVAASSDDSVQIQELQHQNASLAQQVAQLQGELAAATATAAAAATAATAAAAAQRGEEAAATAAKLQLAEQQIQQLMVLAAAASSSGNAEASDAAAELAARLRAAEQDVGEAEVMAAEAVGMAERAQAEAAELRSANAALQASLAALQEQADQSHSSTRWREEREAKREEEWGARLKEAYKRMEESVLLAERTQREKDEAEARCAALAGDKAALEARLDPGAQGLALALEVEAARRAAEAATRVEVDALQQRLGAMEEYVEEADAKRLAMASRVGELEQQLASVRRGEEDSYDQVKAAEDRADGLLLELQCVQGEVARLASELDRARQAAQQRDSDRQRDAADAASRASVAQEQLETTRALLRQEEAAAVELRRRVLALEAETEAARVQLGHAQQMAALAGAAGVAGGAAAATGVEAEQQRRRLESDLAERQRVAEGRAQQLDALSRELGEAREALAVSLSQREALESALGEARRDRAAAASATAELQASLAAQELMLRQAQEAQRSSAAMLVAGRGRGGSAGGAGGEGSSAAELRGRLEAAREEHGAEVAALRRQLGEAEELAAYSAGELAGAVQQLAEARGECGELASKAAELRDEVARLRSGSEGELRARIERAEREATVQRNRAEVNALFKEEHDRIAQELVGTKLVWAEAQETIVKLKRSLVKSQEKSILFASKMTKMETKLYQSAAAAADSTAAASSGNLQKGASKLSKLGFKRGGGKDKDKEPEGEAYAS